MVFTVLGAPGIVRPYRSMTSSTGTSGRIPYCFTISTCCGKLFSSCLQHKFTLCLGQVTSNLSWQSSMSSSPRSFHPCLIRPPWGYTLSMPARGFCSIRLALVFYFVHNPSANFLCATSSSTTTTHGTIMVEAPYMRRFPTGKLSIT